jgi:hypothetical protein
MTFTAGDDIDVGSPRVLEPLITRMAMQPR